MKVSFVIPSYNAATWLPHAVSSALQQSYKNIEVVIVNDYSTDRTQEYLDWIHKNDKRVTSCNPGINVGRSEARNLGNGASTGDIICVLDADDLATPNRAELTVRKFKSSEADYVYGSATLINAIGQPLSVISADMIDRDRCLSEGKNHHLQNRIVHSTVAYRKEFAKQFQYRGGDIAKLGIDDWAQQIEAMAAGVKFDFIPQRLACYRQLDSQITKHRDGESVLAAKRVFLAGLKVPA